MEDCFSLKGKAKGIRYKKKEILKHENKSLTASVFRRCFANKPND